MSNAALQVARTGLDAQNTKMRVIANNLANVNTTGFKKDRADFETLAYQQMVAAGAQSDSENKYAIGTSLGSGVKLAGTSKIDTQGTLDQTGNALDLAIQGSGYFQLQRPDGSIAYTRAGNFSLTAEGTIVSAQGLPLIPQIQVPEGATSIAIGNDVATLPIRKSGPSVGWMIEPWRPSSPKPALSPIGICSRSLSPSPRLSRPRPNP